jgi:hypothetical protein
MRETGLRSDRRLSRNPHVRPTCRKEGRTRSTDGGVGPTRRGEERNRAVPDGSGAWSAEGTWREDETREGRAEPKSENVAGSAALEAVGGRAGERDVGSPRPGSTSRGSISPAGIGFPSEDAPSEGPLAPATAKRAGDRPDAGPTCGRGWTIQRRVRGPPRRVPRNLQWMIINSKVFRICLNSIVRI